jgi:hypothetical protein
MNLEEARRFALSLPGATEEPHFAMTSFRVNGKIFVTVPVDGDHLHIFVDEQEARAVVAERPLASEELWWGKRLTGVRVTLSGAEAGWVCELIQEAWQRRAPKPR